MLRLFIIDMRMPIVRLLLHDACDSRMNHRLPYHACIITEHLFHFIGKLNAN